MDDGEDDDDYNKIISTFLEAFPDLRLSYESFLADWSSNNDEDNPPGPDNVASEIFAPDLIRPLMEAGPLDDEPTLERLLDVADELLATQDSYFVNFARIEIGEWLIRSVNWAEWKVRYRERPIIQECRSGRVR